MHALRSEKVHSDDTGARPGPLTITMRLFALYFCLSFVLYLHCSVNSFRFLCFLLWFFLGPGGLRKATGAGQTPKADHFRVRGIFLLLLCEITVVALWEAFYIENKRFDLDTLRVPNRSPTPISKSNDFLGPSDDIWARGPHFRPI